MAERIEAGSEKTFMIIPSKAQLPQWLLYD